jgi:hypothetical protein
MLVGENSSTFISTTFSPRPDAHGLHLPSLLPSLTTTAAFFLLNYTCGKSKLTIRSIWPLLRTPLPNRAAAENYSGLLYTSFNEWLLTVRYPSYKTTNTPSPKVQRRPHFMYTCHNYFPQIT